jgi:acyl-coenzyme A thioesterase PaaI-like protein
MSSETSIDFRGIISGARSNGEYNTIVQAIPYAQLIGMELFDMSTIAGKLQPIFLMPKNDHNIGNPTLPAIHGGVVGGFMETSAALHLLMTMETQAVPKIIDFSLDYLRAGRHTDTYTSCQVWRQGKRVANVAINAWQTDPDQPIATARAHFLLVQD